MATPPNLQRDPRPTLSQNTRVPSRSITRVSNRPVPATKKVKIEDTVRFGWNADKIVVFDRAAPAGLAAARAWLAAISVPT